ncbi:hypothetical protein THAOC_35638 [Thalassiosira oceanica]|uniref:Uncharacterized protein n=1 Tax=Thalassiosira oceanica TaxID=159749 RepID=K0RGS5_THAOC|nr:hypothetical protein THAOC_35638 [Thalassiosira oceanica]|eukprot:EJK45732.1 hypothetical protein THAOC_35638 [Thalassiosira oceanica]
MAATSTHECPSAADPHVLDILASAVPGFLSYTVPSERVVQANAEGMRVLARFSSTAPDKLEGGGRGGGSTRVTLPADYDEDGIGTAELFVKRAILSRNRAAPGLLVRGKRRKPAGGTPPRGVRDVVRPFGTDPGGPSHDGREAALPVRRGGRPSARRRPEGQGRAHRPPVAGVRTVLPGLARVPRGEQAVPRGRGAAARVRLGGSRGAGEGRGPPLGRGGVIPATLQKPERTREHGLVMGTFPYAVRKRRREGDGGAGEGKREGAGGGGFTRWRKRVPPNEFRRAGNHDRLQLCSSTTGGRVAHRVVPDGPRVDDERQDRAGMGLPPKGRHEALPPGLRGLPEVHHGQVLAERHARVVREEEVLKKHHAHQQKPRRRAQIHREVRRIPRRSVIQPENVVVDVILTRARAHKMEELAEVQRVVPPDLYGARDEDHDGIAARRRLDVRRLHLVLHSPDLFELLDYVCRALELVPLKRHHGLIILFPS